MGDYIMIIGAIICLVAYLVAFMGVKFSERYVRVISPILAIVIFLCGAIIIADSLNII